MCSGVVPVSSSVGAIPELLVDGRNGLTFEAGDILALAGALERVLTDTRLRERLQSEALLIRSHFDYRATAARWDGWLGLLGEPAADRT